MLWGILCSLSTLHSFAQTSTGTLAGRVLDRSGAAIPGAHIVITNPQTESKRELITASEGDYVCSALLAANYDIIVEADGLQRLVRSATIQAGTITTLDFSLAIRSANETVSVDSASPQLQYETYQISGVITRQQVDALPLNGRSFLELTKLEPGARAPIRASGNRLLVPILG
jgi:hypothetical protein